MNTELFKKIHDVIQADPEGFDMGTWEDLNSCGTTRCVAGWAIYFASGERGLYVGTDDGDEGYSPGVLALVERLGVALSGGRNHPVADLGIAVLGLERGDRKLFYTNEETAAEFVRLAAQGDDEAARAVLGHGDA